jgi:RNA polymerase sigma-70 factor (ECF subfamily)
MGGANYFGGALPIRGAAAVAQTFSGRARAAQPALIDGEPGAVWIHAGELRVAFRFTIHSDRITGIELVGDPGTLSHTVIER